MGFLAMPSDLLPSREAQPPFGMPTAKPPPAAEIKNHTQKLESILAHRTLDITAKDRLDFLAQFRRDLLVGIEIQNPGL